MPYDEQYMISRVLSTVCILNIDPAALHQECSHSKGTSNNYEDL
jgi:hypothetical protein